MRTALTSRMKEMASLGVIGSNENLRDACKKKPVFPRTIMRSRNFTMAGKAKRMASNLGQVLRNHQKLTGKIGKRGPASNIHGSPTLGTGPRDCHFIQTYNCTILRHPSRFHIILSFRLSELDRCKASYMRKRTNRTAGLRRLRRCVGRTDGRTEAGVGRRSEMELCVDQ